MRHRVVSPHSRAMRRDQSTWAQPSSPQSCSLPTRAGQYSCRILPSMLEVNVEPCRGAYRGAVAAPEVLALRGQFSQPGLRRWGEGRDEIR